MLAQISPRGRAPGFVTMDPLNVMAANGSRAHEESV